MLFGRLTSVYYVFVQYLHYYSLEHRANLKIENRAYSLQYDK